MATVRPATVDDLPRLRAIQAASLAEPTPEILSPAVDTDLGRVLVLDDERPVGYVVALPAARNGAYVPELAVEPNRQGAGLGSQLLSTLVDDLATDGVEYVRLTARAGDDRVAAFYERHGFTEVERVPGHFETDDGVVLERRI